jgi:tetratricopeptide (TPR) repeat protein
VTSEPVRRGFDGCPDAETLAAFLDGRLSEEKREAVADHLTTCEACYDVFLEAAKTRPATARVVTSPRWWTSRRVLAPAAAVLATAAALVVAVNLGVMPWQRDAGPELTTLVAAIGSDRTIEPRLTGGFAHGPLRAALRSTQGIVLAVSPDVRIAAAQVEKDATARRSAGAARARGVASLVTGDASRAIAALEEAAELEPTNARILSDLAAAYLVRAGAGTHADDLSKALASVTRALTADRSLPEAWFNRALALERLSMRDQARDAWQGYLTIDDRSGWADEARTHLRELDTQP